jgi:hypothetical protein
MPEETPSSPAAPPSPVAPESGASEPKTPFDIGEEFGTARKNLPPLTIVLIGVAAVVLVASIFAFVQRPHSMATGSIDDVVSAEVPNQNSVMVAIHLSVHNAGEKPYWIHGIEAGLDTDAGNFTDQAAPAIDYDRYFQALPALKANSLPALKRETRIEPGADVKGMIIVSFPVTPDAFAKRKALRVPSSPTISPNRWF